MYNTRRSQQQEIESFLLKDGLFFYPKFKKDVAKLTEFVSARNRTLYKRATFELIPTDQDENFFVAPIKTIPPMLKLGAPHNTQLGLFAARNFSSNQNILPYLGEELAANTLQKNSNRWLYSVHISKEQRIIDASFKGSIARFCNSAGNFNAALEQSNGVVWIRTLRCIEIGEEITINYGWGFETKDQLLIARKNENLMEILPKMSFPFFTDEIIQQLETHDSFLSFIKQEIVKEQEFVAEKRASSRGQKRKNPPSTNAERNESLSRKKRKKEQSSDEEVSGDNVGEDLRWNKKRFFHFDLTGNKVKTQIESKLNGEFIATQKKLALTIATHPYAVYEKDIALYTRQPIRAGTEICKVVGHPLQKKCD